MRTMIFALVTLGALSSHAMAQVATPQGFARSGNAGVVGARGGGMIGNRIPYVRPNAFSQRLFRPSRPPGFGYGRYGNARFGNGWNGYGPGRGGYGGLGHGRGWVYDRPWDRYPYGSGRGS